MKDAGTALAPLSSIDEPCPCCGAALEADLSLPSRQRVAFAEASLAREQLEHWWSICRLHRGGRMAIVGVDFTENAKPLAQAAALIEVRRFRLHVALSDVHKALERGDADEAERLARAALEAERDAK